jgi:hypothetical protein
MDAAQGGDERRVLSTIGCALFSLPSQAGPQHPGMAPLRYAGGFGSGGGFFVPPAHDSTVAAPHPGLVFSLQNSTASLNVPSITNTLSLFRHAARKSFPMNVQIFQTILSHVQRSAGVSGLVNLGNTCFMNSSLQVTPLLCLVACGV